MFDYGYKDTAVFSYFQIFLTFFILFSLSAKIPIYAGFFVGRMAVGLLAVCPDYYLPTNQVHSHTYAHTYAHTRTRTGIFRP